MKNRNEHSNPQVNVNATPTDAHAILAAIDEKLTREEYKEEEEDTFVDPLTQASFNLELQSNDAQGAWLGRPMTKEHHGFPGIEWYTHRIGLVVCHAVRDDDPYALMLLRDMEEHMTEFRDTLNTHIRTAEQLLRASEMDGLTFNRPSKYHYTPMTFAVSPRNGYAFFATQLVGRYDRTVLLAHQVRNLGLIRSKQLTIMKNRKAFRQLTSKLVTFKQSGTTRDDFREANAQAQGAVEKFGPVTEEVMDPEFELLLLEVQSGRRGRRPVRADTPETLEA
ncbi:MAG: hypothetical protein CSB44_01940 [Gammaproteobacteria bacterium]|nr:MAG: hypothetical protein CSB44_01940 [Gammaproteobacteria bacterium]